LGVNDGQNWEELCKANVSDLKNNRISSFLAKFGGMLLPSKVPDMKIALELLSRDLNIKFFISLGSTVLETWSFRYSNPVPISFHLKSQNPFTIDYMLRRSEGIHNTPRPDLSKNQEKFLEILQILEQLIENYPLSKEIKSWATRILSQDPQAGKTWSILTSIQKAPNKICLIKELKTSNKSFFELDNYNRTPMAQTPLVFKFGGIEKIDYDAKIAEIINRKITFVEIPNLAGESKTQSYMPRMAMNEEENTEEKKEVKALPSSKSQFHCDLCQNSPLEKEINSIECGCSLSQDCLAQSLVDRKCIACSKPISDSVFDQLNVYFG